MTLNEAYKRWIDTLPLSARSSCCHQPHFFTLKEEGRSWIVYKGDAKVCKRERAWREYVRLRDNNPAFPVNHYLYSEEDIDD